MNQKTTPVSAVLESTAIDGFNGAVIEAVRPVAISSEQPGETINSIALPPGFTLADLEKFREFPRAIKEHVQLTTLGGFTEYVNRYKRPETLVLITPTLESLGTGAALATATLDYHTHAHDEIGEHPRRATHLATFHPTRSPAYALLCSIDGIIMSQEDFAQRLRDLARFCTSHPAGELLEVIQTLQLTSRGEYQSHNDDISGAVRLKFNLEVEARAGTTEKSLTVPSGVDFSVPIFLDDANPTTVRTELLYRVPRQSGGQVQLGIRMPDRKWLEHQLIQGVGAQIREATDLLVLTGTR